MKTGSVLALRPGFFTSAPVGSYARDLSERDRSVRMLVSPESVYGPAWSTGATVVDPIRSHSHAADRVCLRFSVLSLIG